MRSRLRAAVLAAILVPSCAGAAAPTAPARTPATNVATSSLLPDTVDALPAMDLAGFEDLLAQVRGTPLVVNVWASWCGPCRQEAPRLAAAARETPGVQFLGVDILDTRASARGFLAEQGWTFPSVFDATGAIRDGLGLLGQPVTLFYAADGTLVSTHTGPIPDDVLTEGLAAIAP